MKKLIELWQKTINHERPQIVRIAECLECRRRWVEPVEFSPLTQCLTGERREDCPDCSLKPETRHACVTRSPWLMLVGESLINLDLSRHAEQPQIVTE